MKDFKIIWDKKLIFQLNSLKQCFWEEKGKNTFKNFQQSNQNGAILFAVHRGNLSEGINFSDDLCRALFLIGVPFLYKKELKIEQKMQFLDNQNQYDLNGDQWYYQQAIRATNQALGRIIRHINDFGIIYLYDNRYSWEVIKSGLSEWVTEALKYWKNDVSVFRKTKFFFQSMLYLFGRIQVRNKGNQTIRLQQDTFSQIEESKRQRENRDKKVQVFENEIQIKNENKKKFQLRIKKPQKI